MTMPIDHTGAPPLGDIAQERQRRLDARRARGAGAVEDFLAWLRGWPDAAVVARAEDALAAAQAIDYRHPGLDTPTYLAHATRVAQLVMRMAPGTALETCAPALVHNALEIGAVTRDDLAARLGGEVADIVVLLTVDRDRQWDQDYKRGYYKALLEGPPAAALVKIADKLDNIFTICVNPDAARRGRYLDEIEIHLAPLTAAVAPAMVTYLHDLVADARRTGHVALGG
ncbi:MAG: HD domain-containing protein [Pseudomonadota bacterium]